MSSEKHFHGVAAAIDVGSNMIRLAIGRRRGRRGTQVMFKTTIVARVGDGVARIGRLGAAAIGRAERALRRMKAIARAHGAATVAAVATGAFRRAENRDSARRRLETALGAPIAIVTGGREARLALAGVVGPRPQRSSALIDVGGASTELVVIDRGKVRACSVPIGVLELAERIVTERVPQADRERFLAAAARRAFAGQRIRAPRGVTCFAAGGAALALAAWRRRAGYLQFDGGTTTLSARGLERLHRSFASASPAAAARRLGITVGHAHLIGPGYAILVAAMHTLGVVRVRPTNRGVAEGLLEETLDRSARKATE